jgi:putative transport protein
VGELWLFAGLLITVPPILVVGVFARAVLKANFMALSGLVGVA